MKRNFNITNIFNMKQIIKYLQRFKQWVLFVVMRSYDDKLRRDLLIYGNYYELSFKPNIFHKIFRPLVGLPINKKRVDPTKIRLGR